VQPSSGTTLQPSTLRFVTPSVSPAFPDAAFQWDDFAAKNNAELNDNLGNFINRTLKFIYAR